MASAFDLCDVGAAAVADGVLTVQVKGPPLSDEPGADAPDYGDAMVLSALGVSAMPYPADPDGGAQAVVALGVPGADGVVIGMRDTRSAAIVGNLKPGDTVLHSTGPGKAAQVQLKESKRQATLTARTPSGKDLVVSIDGGAGTVSISGLGAAIVVREDGGIYLGNNAGYIELTAAGVLILGAGIIFLGGRTPGAPVLGGAPPGVPTPGVFVATG